MTPARVLLLGVLLWSAPALASAATLAIDPAQAKLAVGDTVTIELKIASDSSINTVGAGVIVPLGLRLAGYEKGAVLTQWIEDPVFNENDSSVSFSGLIAGGWKGQGTLLKLQFVAQKAGTYVFAYDPARTELYQNDGKGTPAPVVFGTVGSDSTLPFMFLSILVALMLLAWFIRRMAWFRFT